MAQKEKFTEVKIFFAVILLFAALFMAYAMNDYMNKWGRLEGDVTFEIDVRGTIAVPDSMKVFLIRGKIIPLLEDMNKEYNLNTLLLEDTVKVMKEKLKEHKENVIKEELKFQLAFGGRILNTADYRTAKGMLDKVIEDRKAYEEYYRGVRDELLKKQNYYNLGLGVLIDNNIILKARVDQYGHFIFDRVPNGEYLLYAIRVLAGDQDITNVPSDTYFAYALEGKLIKKFTWLQRLTVDEDTYIKLDRSNIQNVFK